MKMGGAGGGGRPGGAGLADMPMPDLLALIETATRAGDMVLLALALAELEDRREENE